VDAAGDVVLTGRCVVVDEVLHGLWTPVWTRARRALTCDDGFHRLWVEEITR
jgi:hypothetical protein